MSELRNLLREAKTSLQDLENLLQKARSIDQTQNDHSVLSREELQSYFDETLKILERLPENLRVEEGIQQRGEIKSLHLQMEEVRIKLEEYLGQVETACENNLQNLSECIESINPGESVNVEAGPPASKIPNLNELLSSGKMHFENKDYDACLTVMTQALEVDPGNSEAANFVVEARKKLEDQHLEEELVITIENLKKEAMDQFDEEQYKECEGTFKFLCELEPKNRTLQDYLELSRQKVEETEAGKEISRGTSNSSIHGETSPVEAIAESEPAAEAILLNAVMTSREPEVQEHQASYPSEKPEDHIPEEPSDETNDPRIPWELSGAESQLEVHHETTEATVVKENPGGSTTNPKTKRLVVAYFIGATLFSAILGWLVLRSGNNLNGSLEIQSDPEAAQVFINGEPKGQTRLHIGALAAGNYDLRVEKEGYAPLTQKLTIEKGAPNWLSVRLEKLNIQPSKQEDLQEAAKILFDRGNLLEANRTCDTLLERDTRNRFALKLKDKIRKYYLQQSRSAMLKGRWEEARVTLENTLKVSPRDPEASRQLKVLKTKLRTPVVATDSSEVQLRNKIQEIHRQISVAVNSANYFPPNEGNALDLINQLIALAPSDPLGKETLEQIHQDLVAQAQRKIQTKDFESARALVRQIQVYFPESVELQNLRDTLKAEESKQLETRSPWMQKAELAAVAGRYVTPPNDNVYAYSNRVLTIDPQNQKALSFKKESLSRASAQAKEYINEAKFDEARENYSSLLQLSTYESRFPFVASELKAEMEKLEFNAYPVVHDHSIGSCTGRVRFNAYVFTFVPSGNSKDGFSGRLSEMIVAESSDKLKVQFKNKTFRFEAGLVKSKEENREKIKTIYQQISALAAKAK